MIWTALAHLLTWIGGFLWIRADAKKDARRDIEVAAGKAYEQTRRKVDHADLGTGATDQQRIERLREFADK